MRLNQKLKILIIGGLALAIALPVLAATEMTNSELAADTVLVPVDNDTIDFTLTAKWGFVHGNPNQDKTEKDYSGSIAAGNSDAAKIRLINKLAWDNHDQITSESNPVSWTSKIYGHWDGLRVAIRAKASETITVTTAMGSLAKTAREWFQLSQSEVADFGNNQALIVNTAKADRRRQLAMVWWGVKNNPVEPAANIDAVLVEAPKIDFSGTLTMDSGSYFKLSRTLRFEEGDQINAKDRNHLDWTSYITTGHDGLAVLLVPNSQADLTAGFTLNFPGLNSGWSKHYTFEELRTGLRDTLIIDGREYVIVAGLKNIVKQVVRAKDSDKKYLIEDNVSHLIPSTDILEANGLEEETVAEMPLTELAAFESGDDLDYPDGSVVEEDGNKYLITNGFKRKLATSQIGEKLKKLLKRKGQASSLLSKLHSGTDITSEEELPDSSLVRTPDDSAVWEIQGDKRKVFTTSNLFLDLHKKKFDNVQTISQEKLQSYNWAPPMEYPDGSLVKVTTDPKVYLLQSGKRHWVESEEDLKGLGYDFDDIVDMPDTEFVNYPDGEPVIADEIAEATQY